MSPKIGDKEQFDDNYAYKIVKILKESLPLENVYFRLLRKLGGFNGSKLKRQIDILIHKKYLSSKPGDRRRVYYAVAPSGEKWFHNEELRRRNIEEAIESSAGQSALKGLRGCIERVIEADDRAQYMKIMRIPFDFPKYQASITVEWKIPILKEGEPLENGSYPLVEIGYRLPHGRGKVVLFEEQPKELVDSLKARKIVIDKDAKPQEAPIPKPSAGFSKRMKEKKEKLRKALFGYTRDEKGEIERSR